MVLLDTVMGSLGEAVSNPNDMPRVSYLNTLFLTMTPWWSPPAPSDVARRLAALRLMAPALDANYRACAAAHFPFGV